MRKIKNTIAFLIIATSFFSVANAQTFISKGEIEYEVRTNMKKNYAAWADGFGANLPEFKTNYYKLIFDGNQSVFKFDHWAKDDKTPPFLKGGDEGSIWFTDTENEIIANKKEFAGTQMAVKDSLQKLNWKLLNENRIIAGFNCRKAVAQIFDSVYVFAFYTEEITFSGGPVSLHGLPGTILGVTIPRLYTSWIATKINVNNVATNEIKAPTAKTTMTAKAMEKLMVDRTKDWGNSDNPESKAQMQRMVWLMLL